MSRPVSKSFPPALTIFMEIYRVVYSSLAVFFSPFIGVTASWIICVYPSLVYGGTQIRRRAVKQMVILNFPLHPQQASRTFVFPSVSSMLGSQGSLLPQLYPKSFTLFFLILLNQPWRVAGTQCSGRSKAPSYVPHLHSHTHRGIQSLDKPEGSGVPPPNPAPEKSI